MPKKWQSQDEKEARYFPCGKGMDSEKRIRVLEGKLVPQVYELHSVILLFYFRPYQVVHKLCEPTWVKRTKDVHEKQAENRISQGWCKIEHHQSLGARFKF